MQLSSNPATQCQKSPTGGHFYLTHPNLRVCNGSIWVCKYCHAFKWIYEMADWDMKKPNILGNKRFAKAMAATREFLLLTNGSRPIEEVIKELIRRI